ncbi:NAD(P)-dependent alcohol dehydrogenase [Naasia sp. SYSU D00057]|uniref:NAD(P)-dependent alcohol dehydrogenase n=1 Tax=Naasia sp. SYSU D00057 TaxID=2817380 RepID=UPI001B302F2D|nr:NAD(P)-dependent alcohol dehydrogenase [Naasia sp. SYSU D00057]
MKAWVHHRYGTPDELRLADVPVPTPREDEVLVRVAAVSLNGSDSEALRGYPGYARLGGLRKPRRPILGSDLAGRVEAVGGKVTRFAVGDPVFGDNLSRLGGLGEVASAQDRSLARIPEGLGFREAAALPQGAVIALQGIRDAARVAPGQAVLVSGAGGSAGSFAVQLAKLHGADVTAVDRAAKAAFLRDLGADAVVDFEREDFTRGGKRYDVIFDVFVRRSLSAYLRALRPGGILLFVGGPVRRMLWLLLAGAVLRPFTRKRIRLLIVRARLDDLREVAELTLAGRIRPAIGHVFPFDEAPEAFRLLVDGRALGKVVIDGTRTPSGRSDAAD